MDAKAVEDFRRQICELIVASGFGVTDDELTQIDIIDFGLGNFAAEGVATIDLVNTAGLRIKLMVMLPGQSLPQHTHPPYTHHAGKEETIRVIYGQLLIYIDGADTMAKGTVPPGKENCYILRDELGLNGTDQVYLAPGRAHWFQAGRSGAVSLAFYTQADDRYNKWADPAVKGVVTINRQDEGK